MPPLQNGPVSSSERLPAATRLGSAQLQVADVTRSLVFYENILGLRVMRRSTGGAVLGSQQGAAPLVELVERPGVHRAPRRGHLGLFHIALLLPHREALGQFVRHLAKTEVQTGGMADHHVSEAVYLTDPDGLGVEVYADRSPEHWIRTDEGEVEMTTATIDLQSLLDAAPALPWAGMPAGTTVGHLHLHVGDLGQAEAFYHETLGLDKTVWTYPGALFLSAGGYHHHLGTNVWAGDVPPAGEDEARLLEWTLALPEVDDVEAVARRLQDAGYATARNGRGVRTQDPWGTALRLAPAGQS